MKLVVGCLLLVVMSCGNHEKKATYFEGVIDFKNTFHTKSKDIDTIALQVIFGKTATLYFKEGNFLERYDSGIILEQFYAKQGNKTYLKKNKSDTLYWSDCGQKPEKMIKWELHKKKEKVLNVWCDELVTFYKNKTIRFYFNPDSLVIDPQWYSKYTFSNKNFVAKKMKSLYYKYIIEFKDFSAEVTATAISRQKVSENTFKIPKKATLIKEQ